MEWVLFFIFLSTDLLCVLLCRYSFGKADEYKEGMIYGVHIPADQLSDSGVQKICREGKRQWRLFHRINLPLSLLLCLLCLYDFIVFILVWSIWLILYLAGVYYLILAPHRKMYRMKMANGWIRETGRKIVRIDTVVSAASKKSPDQLWALLRECFIERIYANSSMPSSMSASARSRHWRSTSGL